MVTKLYSEAIRDAIRNEMLRNPDVYCIGEDIGVFNGSFGATAGLLAEFGPGRVYDTPIAEQAITGIAAGSALTGMVPVAEIMYNDFMLCAADQIMNQAAKFRYMYGGGMKVPMTLRMAVGGGLQCAAQHSQSLEGLLVHIPGLKVVYPSTPADAQGLIIAAIRDENPVVVCEHELLYQTTGEVSETFEPIPIGKADVKKEGSDVTVIATGLCVHKALDAAKALAEEGVSVEVVDPRSLFPLDKETIYKSISKTHRAVVVTEECKRGAWSAEMASNIAEDMFDSLKSKIVRVGALNTPIPFAIELESLVIPQTEDIIQAIKSVM
ncbi:alpha-ketoacid dehydrogenase subunit beta [Lactonifactor longoviformis]|uniref:Pyruvate dehydrogenase E1 component beta subunit n=1 Tax=Lactonifactor longoviformis DSM 17459 TaxID=1122155 RepID=A0A1M4X5J0_9CLOT|nr:alpha-ketoacid dehydrogenase subunit beta [Lactonifactor longoviformis]POP31578.1 alpha-ketoacid dehydrogenase subunit beta [Lactonifactor longoviformis]SHE88705.1 pyruvate dehydrogenase E1 component beta subunit [Lactonifactor longoviformis DSM 17459]